MDKDLISEEDGHLNGNIIYLYESEEIAEVIMSNEDSAQVLDEQEMVDNTKSTRPQKREREEEVEEVWTEVRNRKERMMEIRGTTEICITASDKIPKQFALAKLFKSHNISNITKVKYINPYKVSVEFNSDTSAKELTSCQHFLELGWRFQCPFEVGLSYGVIKHIELGLSDKELLESITAPNSEVVSVKRLKRRITGESGWTESESVRVAFKGSFLPTYLCIFGMKVKVDPYLFPVTQCSRCWRYGHTHLMCPSTRVYCPKCGGKHDNCETTTFKCVNCALDHIALNRSCPIYLKEKKIREIMAELNVSYRTAVSKYVPPVNLNLMASSTSLPVDLSEPVVPPIITPSIPKFHDAKVPVQEKATYAQAASTSKAYYTQPEDSRREENLQKKRRNKKKQSQTPLFGINLSEGSDSEGSNNNDAENAEQKKKEFKNKNRRVREDIPFLELLTKIKDIIFLRSDSLKDKIQNIIQICMKWFTTWVFNNIPNLPVLQTFFS